MPEVKQLIGECNQLKNRATMDITIGPKFKVVRNKVTSELRNCVQQYCDTIVKENCNDPKDMWKTIEKEIEVSQEIIGRVTKIKYLGPNIDENLSWNDQYKKLKLRLKVASLHFRG